MIQDVTYASQYVKQFYWTWVASTKATPQRIKSACYRLRTCSVSKLAPCCHYFSTRPAVAKPRVRRHNSLLAYSSARPKIAFPKRPFILPKLYACLRVCSSTPSPAQPARAAASLPFRCLPVQNRVTHASTIP